MSEWDYFLSNVKKAEAELGYPKEIWYRGQADTSWKLTPSLLRIKDWESKEHQLLYEYKKTASKLFKERVNDLENLFNMQHYGIPTRLLDWTTVMGMAIAFIIYDEYEAKTDGALFILDPIALNRMSDDIKGIINPQEGTFAKRVERHLKGIPLSLPNKPIAIQPDSISQNERLQAQKGTFTLHGHLAEGLETMSQSCVKKVPFPQHAKQEALQFLKWGNLDEYTIFPDIVGMARYIKRKVL